MFKSDTEPTADMAKYGRRSKLEFWSSDGRYGLVVEGEETSVILDLCRESKDKETGGILVGYYSANQRFAIVTAVSKPPSDSRQGRFWFIRGRAGLQKWIDSLWRHKRHYYLGEWHFHPSQQPNPSPTDIRQMKEISESPPYICPEPILLIIGYLPASSPEFRAYVFPKLESFQEMKSVTS